MCTPVFAVLNPSRINKVKNSASVVLFSAQGIIRLSEIAIVVDYLFVLVELGVDAGGVKVVGEVRW